MQGIVAMNAVASLAATKPGAWAFVEELWRTPVPTGKYRQVPNRPPQTNAAIRFVPSGSVGLLLQSSLVLDC